MAYDAALDMILEEIDEIDVDARTTVKLDLRSYNGSTPKYTITRASKKRDGSPGATKSFRVTKDEMGCLVEMMQELDPDDLPGVEFFEEEEAV